MERMVRYLAAHETRSWRFDGSSLVPGEAAPGAAVVAVVDYAEESYVLTKLPALRGRDGSLLRRRRLEREFPGVALAAARALRPSPDGEGTEAVMIAVPGGQALNDSLEGLAAGYAVRAVTTPALLAGEWLRRARVRGRRVLIVLPTPAGVRLIFLDDGWPTLSRLTGPLAPQATATELARTVQYLQNTQRVGRGEAVELWFWGIDDATAAACVPTGVEVAPAAAPRVASLPDPERDGLEALLALAADAPGPLQLAPDVIRVGWLAREFERGCRLAAAAALLLAVLAGGVLEWRISRQAAALGEVVASRASIEQEETEFAAALGARGLSLAEVATTPEAERALADGGIDPLAGLAVVGVGFGAQPDVVIQAVELRAAPQPGTADAAALPVVSAMLAEDAVPASAAEAAAGCDAGPAASIMVEFGLASGLPVRRRDAALGWVREASGQLAPWRASAAVGAIGRGDALVVTAERDEARADARWAVCLRREVGT